MVLKKEQCNIPFVRHDKNYGIMGLQELLEMNIEIATLLNAPQVQLPPILKGLIQKLLDENEAKLKEISE